GPVSARGLYYFELFAPYITLIALVALKVLPWACLLAVLTLPLALKLYQTFATVKDERSELLMPTVENTAKLHMAFGMLLTIGIIVGAIWL
ncbi:MAG: hypothetical protein M3R04_08025, partial [bacterium]|nr:hypothetical protein [bacterium]